MIIIQWLHSYFFIQFPAKSVQVPSLTNKLNKLCQLHYNEIFNELDSVSKVAPDFLK